MDALIDEFGGMELDSAGALECKRVIASLGDPENTFIARMVDAGVLVQKPRLRGDPRPPRFAIVGEAEASTVTDLHGEISIAAPPRAVDTFFPSAVVLTSIYTVQVDLYSAQIPMTPQRIEWLRKSGAMVNLMSWMEGIRVVRVPWTFMIFPKSVVALCRGRPDPHAVRMALYEYLGLDLL